MKVVRLLNTAAAGVVASKFAGLWTGVLRLELVTQPGHLSGLKRIDCPDNLELAVGG